MAKIIITGANSELGTILTSGLSDLGHIVIHSSRLKNTGNYFDLMDKFISINLTPGDVVLHLALDRKLLRKKNRHYNIEGTVNLAEYSIIQNKAKFFYLSTESTNFPFSNYAIVKKQTELALRKLPVTVIRVSTILDKDFSKSSLKIFCKFPFKVFSFILVPSFMLKKNIFKCTYLSEIINCINEQCKGASESYKIITTGNNHYLNLNEILKIYFLNKKIKIIKIPLNYFIFTFILEILKIFSKNLKEAADSIKIFKATQPK